MHDRPAEPERSAAARRAPPATSSSAGSRCCAISTCAIPRGQTLAVIGESGCGKTVLLKTLIGLIQPDARRSAVRRPEPAEAAATRSWSQQRIRFGFVFQNAALFDSMTDRPERRLSAAAAQAD